MALEQKEKRKEILEKRDILKECRKQLKKEFIGIDCVIDEVMDAMSSWYLFPDLQIKPVVINLWGLTGTGKSSLVSRIAELINFEKKFYNFDLGETNNEYGIKSKIKNLYAYNNAMPVMFAFDEFQHARTLDEFGKEKDVHYLRIVWQLLDSGKFHYVRTSDHLISNLHEYIQGLKFLVSKGIQVINGMITGAHPEIFKKMDDMFGRCSYVYEYENDKKNRFISEYYYDQIYTLAPEEFSSLFEVESILMQFNEIESINFLNRIIEKAYEPKLVDCSRALIFNVGNLDEAYTMNADLDPDMSADEFHEQSLKISVPNIKNALRQRFRSEQIARLGNIHIIYPAFSKDSFDKLIGIELAGISDSMLKAYGLEISFDRSIREMLYKEGVYPTQGTRPLFSTIHMLIKTKMGKLLTKSIIDARFDCTIVFSAEENIIHTKFYRDNSMVDEMLFTEKLSLHSLRKSKKDDLQSITAVHESGHAIIASILMKTIPEVIYSNTANVNNSGFVHSKFMWDYISRKEIRSRLALFLGGYAAEKIIFGKENLTAGAGDDIQKATSFASIMLKQYGMGEIPASYQNESPATNNFLYDNNYLINKELEQEIQSALELAEHTLRKQEKLLIKMADYLSDHRMLTKEKIRKLIDNYALDFEIGELIENGSDLFYREHLKNMVKGLESKQRVQLSSGTKELYLNRESE